MKDFFGYILCIVLLPIIILTIIVETVGSFITGKSENGASKKIPFVGIGALIFMIPAFLMGGLFLIWGVCWIFVTFGEILRIGHPLLIFLGIIVPVVGSVFMLIGFLKN